MPEITPDRRETYTKQTSSGGFVYYTKEGDPGFGYVHEISGGETKLVRYPIYYLWALFQQNEPDRPSDATRETATPQHARELTASALEGRVAVLYGQPRVGGNVFFLHAPSNTDYLYVGWAIAEGINDSLVLATFDEKTLASYGSAISLNFYPGSLSPAAVDPLLLAAEPTYVERHPSLCYAVARLTYTDEVLSSFPQAKFVIKGRKLYDYRTALTAWSDNNALALADWITNAEYGMGDAVNAQSVIDAANYCDELDANGQKRFTLNLAITAEADMKAIRDTIAATFRCSFVRRDGELHFVIDKAKANSFALTADNTRPVRGRPKLTDEIANRVVVWITDPARNYETIPCVAETAGVTDGTEEPRTMEVWLQGLDTPSRGQRQANYLLNKQIVGDLEIEFDVSTGVGLKIEPGDVGTYTSDEAGLAAQQLRVISGAVDPNLGGRFVAVKYAASIYDDSVIAAETKPSSSLPQNLEMSAGVLMDGSPPNFVPQFDGSATVVNGANDALALSATRDRDDLTGASAPFSVGGIVAGNRGGQQKFIKNATAQAGTIEHEKAGATAANRIATPNGANVSLPPGATAFLIYNSVTSRWDLQYVNSLAAVLGVTSFNTRTGAVTPALGDYSQWFVQKIGDTLTGALNFSGVGGAFISAVAAVGSPTYIAIDNTPNAGGKKWRAGYTGAVAGGGSFDLYNETDALIRLSISASNYVGVGGAPIAADFDGATGVEVFGASPGIVLKDNTAARPWLWYASTSGKMEFYDSTASATRFSIDTGGVVHIPGYVGVGRLPFGSTPFLVRADANNLITVQAATGFGAGYPTIATYNDDGSAYVPLWGNASWFGWAVQGSEKMRLDASGKLGVGGEPTAYFDLRAPALGGDSVLDYIAWFGKATTNATMLNIRVKNGLVDLAADYRVGGGGPFTVLTFSTTPIGLAPVERMRLDQDGNVSVANGNLNIFRSGAAHGYVDLYQTSTTHEGGVRIRVGNGTTSGKYAYFRSEAYDATPQLWDWGLYGSNHWTLYNATAGRAHFRALNGGSTEFYGATNGSQAVYFLGTVSGQAHGSLNGIVLSPSHDLYWYDSNVKAVRVGSSLQIDATDGLDLNLNAVGNVRLAIGGGSVGVNGSPGPGNKFDVVNGVAGVSNVDGMFLRTYAQTNTNYRWAFENSASGVFSINQRGDNWSDEGSRFLIDRSGNVRVPVKFGVGAAPYYDLEVNRGASGNSIIATRGSDPAGQMLFYAESGNGTTSSRYAFSQYTSYETVSQNWIAGMYGTKDFWLRNYEAGVNVLKFASVGGSATFDAATGYAGISLNQAGTRYGAVGMERWWRGIGTGTSLAVSAEVGNSIYFFTNGTTAERLLIDTAGHTQPGSTWSYDLGTDVKRWRSLYAAELRVETLVAQDTIATIGGRILVGPTTKLTTDIPAANGTIYVEHNNLAVGDVLYLCVAPGGVQQVEFMVITSGPTGTGPYTYNVTRNLDGTGANDWKAGDAVFNTGATGDGFIDIYSIRGTKAAGEEGPTIVGNVRNSATFNDWSPRWAVGNLKGIYGYAATEYGCAFGVPSAAWVKIDPTNGIRIGHNATTKISLDASGNASFTGSITAASGTIGGFTIGADVLYAGTGATRINLSTATGIHLGTDNFALAPFSVSLAGVLKATSGTVGGWTLGATSLVAGSGATTVGLDSGGTNPAIYAGSATPGSAPFRVTNAGALTATNADITGTITASSGTIGGFGIGSTNLIAGSGTTRVGMDTNNGFYCGNSTPASAPFQVTPGGALRATNANITGTITSGNVTINPSGAISITGSSSTSAAVHFDNATIWYYSTGNTLIIEGYLGAQLSVGTSGGAGASPWLNITGTGAHLKVSGTKVVGAQGAAVADATGAGDIVAQFNTWLARARAHGLIA